MSELLTRLITMRAELVGTMTAAVEAEENWSEWLPLLAQIEVSIRAVRIVETDQEPQS